MKINNYGEYVPDLPEHLEKSDVQWEYAARVCPFLNPEENEDYLSEIFLSGAEKRHEATGRYYSISAGYVKEMDFRNSGTSGGFGSWILHELLRSGLVDGVIHLKRSPNSSRKEGEIFSYQISFSSDEIRQGSGTKYHASHTADVLQLVSNNTGRFALIGVPCVVKSIRRLQLVDSNLRERLPYVISLVCGHMKSIFWTDSLAWSVGIEPSKLQSFRYRCKGDGIDTRAYVFKASDGEKEIQMDSARVVGGKFNAGAMMLNACDYCDDVLGETADLTIGDAWLPRFDHDTQGTNLLIVRNKIIAELLDKAALEGRIYSTSATADEAARSQSGGLRHRREGLAYRLHKLRKSGIWHPVKRVAPDKSSIGPIRKFIYDLRSWCASSSRHFYQEAITAKEYKVYSKNMWWRFRILRTMEIASNMNRIISVRIQRISQRILRKNNK